MNLADFTAQERLLSNLSFTIKACQMAKDMSVTFSFEFTQYTTNMENIFKRLQEKIGSNKKVGQKLAMFASVMGG